MEKKSERLEVRLGYQEKQDFTEACDLQGDTPSGAIRRFINGYVRRADGDVLASAWRGAAKRKLIPVMAAAVILFIFGFGTHSAFTKFNQPSDEDIFAFRDANNDGELDASEYNIPPDLHGEPNAVMRVLDIDASGTISRAEFVREGRMVYVISQDEPAKLSDKNNPKANLVEFKFTKNLSESNDYVGATINAKGLDRLVIWPRDGRPTVLEGEVKIATGIENIEFQADTITVPPQSK